MSRIRYQGILLCSAGRGFLFIATISCSLLSDGRSQEGVWDGRGFMKEDNGSIMGMKAEMIDEMSKFNSVI